MSSEPTPPAEGRSSYERVIGRLVGDEPGPTILITVGLHGNEHAGPAAGRRVLERVAGTGGLRRGELVVVAGNLRALSENIRFIRDQIFSLLDSSILNGSLPVKSSYITIPAE